MAVVTGRVSDLSARPAGTLVFFEGNSKGDFCGFIPKEHDLKMAEAYARNLADSLVGKTIALSGRISLHQGAPQIVIETPGQIQIRN
jgi:hypothetical protein